MPTITIPVNAFEIPSASTAGSSAPTNQSETKAAATPAAAEQHERRRERQVAVGVLLERRLAVGSERRYDHSQAP